MRQICTGVVFVCLLILAACENQCWYEDESAPLNCRLVDHDGDGYCAQGADYDGDGRCTGDGEGSYELLDCWDISGDAADEAAAVNPAADEVCSDDTDNNCNGEIDEDDCVE